MDELLLIDKDSQEILFEKTEGDVEPEVFTKQKVAAQKMNVGPLENIRTSIGQRTIQKQSSKNNESTRDFIQKAPIDEGKQKIQHHQKIGDEKSHEIGWYGETSSPFENLEEIRIPGIDDKRAKNSGEGNVSRREVTESPRKNPNQNLTRNDPQRTKHIVDLKNLKG